MPYLLDNQEYFYDMGENTDLKGFFDKMRAGSVPKTQALNEYDYTQYFEPILARGEDIYYITFSHQMSGTFNAMKNAIANLKEKYPEREIRFKDSKLISLGSGFVSYYGALKYREGATMDELDAYLDELIGHTAIYFVVDDLTYLHRGGRLSRAAWIFGSILQLKPLLQLGGADGKVLVIGKERGKVRAMKALAAYLNEMRCDENYPIIPSYTYNSKNLDELLSFTDEKFKAQMAERDDLDPAIACHWGPGAFGYIFVAK